MITLGSHGKDGHVDIGQRHGPARCDEVAFSQLVVEKQFAQILRMHTVRQTRGIGIPGHQIGQRLTFHRADSHARRATRPQSFDRRAFGRRPAHCRLSKNPCSHIIIFKKGDLAFIDKQHQFAGFGKVGLSGEQRLAFSSLSSPSRAIAAAATESNVPPRQ